MVVASAQPSREGPEILAVFSSTTIAMEVSNFRCTRRVHRSFAPAAVLAALALASVACCAQGGERTFDLHGYGQFAQIKNESAPGGSFELDYSLSALGVWRMRPDMRAWLQLARYKEAGNRLEWAFLDWDVSGTTTARLGQMRVPMGLINEARDVQTLRNAITMPMLYDEKHGLVDEAMRGVLVEHRREALDAGALIAETYAAGSMVSNEHSSGASARIVGGRLQWTPPSSAWGFALSGYAGRQASSELGAAPGHSARHALVLSAKRRVMDWDVGAEVGAGRTGEGRVRVGYLQADRELGSQAAFFARAESTHRRAEEEDAAEWHNRFVLGLAWKPSARWGFRFEAAANRASSTEPASSAAPLRSRWNDVGVSFNFYL